MLTIETVAKWEGMLGVRRTTVLMVTVWMTWRAFTWAAEFASHVSLSSGDSSLAAAAIIAAVTAPISMLQAAVFKAYLNSKESSE